MKNNKTLFIKSINDKFTNLTLYSVKNKYILPLVFVILYLFFYFSVDLSSQSLIAHDEGLYARRSRLLEESNNWFLSPFESAHHKTLGSYWLIALSIKLFGTSELSLRLPSIVLSVICLLISFLITKIILNQQSALISICSLASMPLWIKYSRYASPDISFVLCILLVIYFFIKFITSYQSRRTYYFAFLSGFFISLAFFIRSYMVFVPLLGLAPFLINQLNKVNYRSRNVFFLGILIGLIPTLVNLYYAYYLYGIEGISSLFFFARQKVIGDFNPSDVFLPFLNILYLTFPIGILFLFCMIFIRNNNKIRFPLLVYCYPLISFFTLYLMSNTYSHYYLFLLPSLSLLFSSYIPSLSIENLRSRKVLNFLIFFIINFIFVLILYFLFSDRNYISTLTHLQVLIIYIVISLISISTMLSMFTFYISRSKFKYKILFYNFIITQFTSLSLLYNFGILGSPNYKTKSFLRDSYVNSIIKTNTIYLVNVNSKIETLLSYYLPSSERLKMTDQLSLYNYIFTSDVSLVNKLTNNKTFATISNYDHNFLLMNIVK